MKVYSWIFNSLIWCRGRYTVTHVNNYSKNIFCWYWAGWCQRRNGSVNKKRKTCIVVVVAALHNPGYYSTTIISFKSGPNLKLIALQSWNRSSGYHEVCGSRTDRCLCFVSRIIVKIKGGKQQQADVITQYLSRTSKVHESSLLNFFFSVFPFLICNLNFLTRESRDFNCSLTL